MRAAFRVLVASSLVVALVVAVVQESVLAIKERMR